MFITRYDSYKTWHPAEGGIMLTGKSMEESIEVNSKEEAFKVLEEKFTSALKEFDIPYTDCITIVRDNGFTKEASSDEVTIRLSINRDILFENYYEDEEGFANETCKCYLIIDSIYNDGLIRYYAESEQGLHARPAYYC